jgi:hypothetical protein
LKSQITLRTVKSNPAKMVKHIEEQEAWITDCEKKFSALKSKMKSTARDQAAIIKSSHLFFPRPY